jgi:hypothetical protein
MTLLGTGDLSKVKMDNCIPRSQISANPTAWPAAVLCRHFAKEPNFIVWWLAVAQALGVTTFTAPKKARNSLVKIKAH